jgi:hypothetical protein
MSKFKRRLHYWLTKFICFATGIKVGGEYLVTCHRPDGSIRWQDTAKNLVTTQGLVYIVESLFKSGLSSFVAIDPWYVGLTDSTPTPAAGDTLASHAGWVEFDAYDEAARQAFVEGDVGAGPVSVSNSANKAQFTIDTNSSVIGGAFLCSVATAGDASDVLLCVAPFTGGDKNADDNDTLDVQYTFTAADDGA